MSPREAAGRGRLALRACTGLPQGRRGAGSLPLPDRYFQPGAAFVRLSGGAGDGSCRIRSGTVAGFCPDLPGRAQDKRAPGFAAVGLAFPVSPAPLRLLIICIFVSRLDAVDPLLLVFLFKSLFLLFVLIHNNSYFFVTSNGTTQKERTNNEVNSVSLDLVPTRVKVSKHRALWGSNAAGRD